MKKANLAELAKTLREAEIPPRLHSIPPLSLDVEPLFATQEIVRIGWTTVPPVISPET